MLLAVSVCTYFEKKKKSQIHFFSDIVRLPYRLSFLLGAGLSQAGGQSVEEKGSERKRTPVRRAWPPGNVTHPAGPLRGREKWGLSLVNGSALAILVVRGAAERFATFVCLGFGFLIKGKPAGGCWLCPRDRL